MSSLQLSGFEVLEKRGQGGMATVWKARQISLNRTVAIKILNTRLVRDENDVQRFQTEAQSAARLKHPGIVQVYDARVEHGLYYYVMEYVEGHTAGEWLRLRGGLTEKDILLLADGVADALEYAWNKEQIIHCDIKPENIMIDADGTVKVADLGLARSINAMTAGAAAEEIQGTPAYISPEQSKGSGALDFRSDIYSLGATMYHLLTGHMLFEGRSEVEILDLQITSSVDDPLDSTPKISKAICWLLEKMLAKDAALRHESWAAVRADIERVKKGLAPRGVKNLPEGCSTIRRSTRRAKADSAIARRIHREEVGKGQHVVLWVALAFVVLLAVLAALRLGSWRGGQGLEPGRGGTAGGEVGRVRVVPPEVTPAPHGPVHVDAARAAALYEEARRWSELHLEEFEKAQGMFEKVAREAGETAYGAMARNEVERLAKARTEAIEQVMESLKVQATVLADRGEFGEAAAVFDRYGGRFAELTAPLRLEEARKLRRRAAVIEQEQMREQWSRDKELREALAGIVTEVTAGRLTEAAALAGKAAFKEGLAAKRTDFLRLRGVLAEAAKSDENVAESFRAQIGKEIAVQLNTGTLKVQIQDVKDRTVTALENRTVGMAVATRRVTFTLDDLKPSERLARMGPEGSASVALAKGLLAVNSRSWAVAAKCFESTDPMISLRLINRVEELKTESP